MEHFSEDRPETPGNGQAVPRDPVLRRHADQLLQVVEPAVAVARGARGFFLSLALLSLLSGVVLLLVLFMPVESASIFRLSLMGTTAFVFLLPGLLLLLFYMGLTQLIAIPGELAESLGQLEHRGAEAMTSSRSNPERRSPVRRLLTLLRSLVDVRTALLASRDVLTRGAILVRVANPITLILVLAATVLSLILVVATAVLGVVMLLG